MFLKGWRAAAVAAFVFALAAPSAQAQALKSPEQVKTALQLVMSVTNDFDRQIQRKTFNRLPHENQEFGEAAGALRKAVADEPAPFKQKVEDALKDASAAAQSVADKSASNDEAALRAGHQEMVKKVDTLIALFPEPLRPDPHFMMGRPPSAPAPGGSG
jgi:hypothetical protein